MAKNAIIHNVEQTTFDERELNLRQLVILTIRRWKILCAIAVAGAILGSAYILVKGVRVGSSAAKPTTAQTNLRVESEQEYENAMIKYNQQKETNAYLRELYDRQLSVLEEELQEQASYTEQSALMQLDPAQVFHASAYIEIIRDNRPASVEDAIAVTPTENARLTNAYLAALSALDYLKEAADRADVPAASLHEVVMVSDQPDPLTAVETTDSGSLILYINAYGKNTQSVKAFVQGIVDRSEELRSQLETTHFPHHLQSSETVVTQGFDYDLFTRQRIVRDAQRGTEYSIDSIQRSLAGLTEPVEPFAPSAASAGGSTIRTPRLREIARYAIFGFGSGLVLSVLCIMIYLVMSNRVLSADEFNRRYHLREITVLPDASQGKKRSAFDRRLMLFGVDNAFERMTDDERYSLAESNLSVYAAEADSIVLAGSVGETVLEELKQRLQNAMKDKAFLCAPNMMRSAASMELIQNHKHVVLVEGVSRSHYAEIDREIQQLSNWQRDILGSIVIF